MNFVYLNNNKNFNFRNKESEISELSKPFINHSLF